MILTWFIIAVVSLVIFMTYNITMLSMFGIPYSLSGTYYYLNDRKDGAGIWFTIFMCVTFLLLLPSWVALTGMINSWSRYFAVLPFITCACMCFVGIAPNIRTNKRIEIIHITCAAVGAACALLWFCVVCWKITYIFPAWVLVCGGIAHATKTAKRCRDYWLEMTAFGTIFTAIITEFILQIF